MERADVGCEEKESTEPMLKWDVRSVESFCCCGCL